MGLLLAGTAQAGPLDQEHPGPVRIAVAGATRDADEPWTADALVADITRWDPNLVVLTGEYVSRGSHGEWRDLADRWTTVGDRLIALPDAASRRGDKELARWRSRIPIRVKDLPGATWAAGTLVSRGVRWRVVVLDTEQTALGARWLDEASWLPKVLADGGADDGYDHLLVFTGRPLASLQVAPPAGSRATRELLGAVMENAPPGKLRAVVSGGTRTNELLLHAGAFGEAHVVAGDGAVGGADLARRGRSGFEEVGELALASGFDRAIRSTWSAQVGPPPEVYGADALALRGWWQVVLDGDAVSLAFRLEDDGVHQEIYQLSYTRERGWVTASALP